MPSAILPSLIGIRQYNYASLASLTAVGYDYILVLSQEIEYIWSKPWTWVSTLFILVRYCGLLSLVSYALLESSFIPGVEKIRRRQTLGDIKYWAYLFFLGAADFVMILRVWAMYRLHSRSRMILGILLTLFSIEIISMVAAAAFHSNPKYDQYLTIRVLEYSICTTGAIALPTLLEVAHIFQITFAAVLCMLAIVECMMQTLQMYRETKQWKLNRYIKLLVQQGILYFFAIFLLNLMHLLNNLGEIPSSGWQFILACILTDVPAIALIPRFIISIREMYARDAQGGREGGIDTGFGLSALSSHGGVSGEPIMFAAGVESEVTDDAQVDDAQNEGTGNIILVLREASLYV